GDHRSGRRPVGRLAHADEGSRAEELPVGSGEPREERRRAPDGDPHRDQAGPGDPVTQDAERYGAEEIEDHECGGERAQGGVGEPEILLDEGEDTGEDLAVHVAEQVDRKHDPESIPGLDRGHAVVGLHEAERYDAILDVERCLLQSDALNAVLGEVRGFVRERGWSVYRQESEEGLLRFLMLREGKATGEVMVNLVTAAPDVP